MGREIGKDLPNATQTTKSYDLENRLAALQSTGEGSPVISEAYTYDPVRNRLTLLRRHHDRQLPVQRRQPAAVSRLHNLCLRCQRQPRREECLDRAYTYDDLLAKVDDAGKAKVTSYGYDGLNRRTFKASQGQVQVSYLYDGLEVLQEVAGADTERIMTYFRANNQIVSRQEKSSGGSASAQRMMTVPPQSQQQFYVYDGLGSVSALVNDNGNITDRYQHDAFGEFTKTLNSEENPEDVFNNAYTFAGRRIDTENGLYTFHFRQYDSGAGVWTTPDPIGILGGLNLYSYVHNNPVNWVDLLGLTVNSEALNDAAGDAFGADSFGRDDTTDSLGGGGGNDSFDVDSSSFSDPKIGLNVNDYDLGVDRGRYGLGPVDGENVATNFLFDVLENIRITNLAIGNWSKGLTLGFGSSFARTYGGYTLGQYLTKGVAPHLGKHLTTIGLVGYTTVADSILIGASFETGIAIGSVLKVTADRLSNYNEGTCE